MGAAVADSRVETCVQVVPVETVPVLNCSDGGISSGGERDPKQNNESTDGLGDRWTQAVVQLQCHDACAT